jgi:hypothetical protein
VEALEYLTLDCPYCGESIEFGVDTSAGEQSYIEDCSVCCRPIEVRVAWDGDAWSLSGARDDD